MQSKQISIREVAGLNEARFVEIFGVIYEHSPWIALEVFSKQHFPTIADLAGAMREVVSTANLTQKLDLLRAHPDLVGRLAREGVLTKESSSEQSAAGLDQVTPDEAAAFQRWNAEYQEKFGFPFIICVRKNRKERILQVFPERLARLQIEEQEAALAEVHQIAALRLTDLLVEGKITTHVLDIAQGVPAAGVGVRLEQIDAERNRHLLGQWKTNADGRVDSPLLEGTAFLPGCYELTFAVGEYFASTPGILDDIPIRVRLSEERHYHIPLLISPWAYSTYRGS